MIQYPEGLPAFERTGYGLETVDPQVRTTLGNGRMRIRQGFKYTPQIITCSAVMNEMEAQIFQSWWHNTLMSGTQWFEGPVLTPLGLERRAMRFIDVYDGPNPWGLCMWRFGLKLELRKPALIPEEWLGDGAEWILHASEFDILMNRTWPEA